VKDLVEVAGDPLGFGVGVGEGVTVGVGVGIALGTVKRTKSIVTPEVNCVFGAAGPVKVRVFPVSAGVIGT
jgi:hypothetical protein